VGVSGINFGQLRGKQRKKIAEEFLNYKVSTPIVPKLPKLINIYQ
jgi:hypothetical protein